MKKLLTLAACIFLVACSAQPMQQVAQSASSSSSAPSIRGLALYQPGKESEQVMVGVEIASTPEERERGMMYRTDFGEANGMLFLFDEPQPLSFWMKNTLIPLDALFFDGNADFVSAVTMVPCEADPCTIYGSAEPAMSVLEVPAGFLEKYGIGRGWKVRLME